MPLGALDVDDGRPPMAERVRAEMARANLKYAFAMGSLDGPKDDPLGVAGILDLARSVPGLKAIGVADPRRTDPAHLKAVEAQLDRHRGEIVAFKAYLGYLHFGPEDPNYVPYYRLAAKYDLPVVAHTGDNWSTSAKVKFAHPLRMDEVAVDHPDVRFVLAHFGNPWLADAAEVVFKTPTSGPSSPACSSAPQRTSRRCSTPRRFPTRPPGSSFPT
jgi:hypothetical protein